MPVLQVCRVKNGCDVLTNRDFHATRHSARDAWKPGTVADWSITYILFSNNMAMLQERRCTMPRSGIKRREQSIKIYYWKYLRVAAWSPYMYGIMASRKYEQTKLDLLDACSNGDLEKVRYLVRVNRLDPSKIVGPSYATALHYAIRYV